MYSIKIANINEFKNGSSKIIIHDATPIAVFKNGDELSGSDFSTSGGNTVTLNDAATVDDDILIILT